MATAPRRYGWKKDISDQRDRRCALPVNFPVESLPQAFSFRSKLGPVWDQKTLACCTGMTVCGIAHYRELTDNLSRTITPSVLFQYYNTRLEEGTVRYDAGASIRDSIKALVDYGIVDTRLCPFNIAKFASKPSKAAYAAASKLKGVEYWRVNQDLNSIKHQLFLGNPVAFGFSVYQSFESAAVAKTGIMPVPNLSERLLGGHAVYICGWDDVKNAFDVRNSWSRRWGDDGNFWMPYPFIINPNLADDFWSFGAFVEQPVQ